VLLLTYNATQAESRNRLIELSANLVGKRLEVTFDYLYLFGQANNSISF
jgi:hypothetical protein